MMSVESRNEYVPGDPILIRDIIGQLKSQGVFDQFRKECISDVDTKPAYQNLCHRVDGQVSSYLSDVRWGPDLNKNQLRENIRKFVNECTFVEPGIARIVDQLVNPRINTVLVPKVEDIVYQYIGIPPIERKSNESFRNLHVNHKFENQDSCFEKLRPSKSSLKRNYENESSWLKSPSKTFEDHSHSRKDSFCKSSFDSKSEPRDGAKGNNGDSRTDFFHSEDDDSRAYSPIDSDEDNLNDDIEEPSPAFELISKTDTYCAESDHSGETTSSKNILRTNVDNDEKFTSSNAEHNDECPNTDLPDDRLPDNDVEISEETPPVQFDVPKTPTINYETSEDSDDSNYLKEHNTHQDLSVERDHGSLSYDIPDFSCVDKIAEKIVEDNRDHEKLVSASDEKSPADCDSDSQKSGTVEPTPKTKEEKTDKHQKDGEKDTLSKSTDAGTKDTKHRDRKHSEHRKEKHRSDNRDSSRDDRDRRNHREKERSNHDSSKSRNPKSRNESRDKSRKSSDEKDSLEDEASSKSKNKDDHKSHRSRDKDDRKHKTCTSAEKRSKDDKSKEKRSKSDDGRDERKKSKHDGDRSKDGKKSSQDDDKMKYKKSEGSENKKSSKSQCGNDEKKARTDRRSSDRDSNGPTSSSNHSHHRSSSKSDKEKHSDKSKHTSSLSTSHKSKKNDSVKCTLGKDGCESSLSFKHRENSHHEKRKDERVASNRTGSGSDLEQLLQTIHAIGGIDSKTKERTNKSPDVSPYMTPAKRSFTETNSEELVTASNDLVCDGSDSSSKTSEKNQSVFSLKKPKIARNESEFGKVVRLRKEYKEKMKLLQQQGKENTNYVSESCQENDDLRLLERLSAASTLKETRVGSNSNKNGAFKEMKISIARIDSSYTIVNGSCYINDVSGCYEYNNHASELDKTRILTETDSKTSNFKIIPSHGEKQDKLFKIKICRSVSPSSGKERTKCVPSSACEIKETISNPIPDHSVVEDGEFYPPSENEDELAEEDHMNDELLRKMNIEEIIGCRTDCTRISYDSGFSNEKTGSDIDDVVKNHTVDKNMVLFDEHNKENVGTETRCLNDASPERTFTKNSPEIHYFEPSSPNNDFTKFVGKLVQESENIFSPNFSIELNYPEEYDAIFQSQLGATVKRVVNAIKASSNPAITENKASYSAEKLTSHFSKETLQFNADTKNSLTPINPLDDSSCPAVNSEESKYESSNSDQVVAEERKSRIVNTSKRKTLGIKRKISNVGGNCSMISKTSDLSKDLHHKYRTEVDLTKPSPPPTIAADKNMYSYEDTSTTRTCENRPLEASEENENKRIYVSCNNSDVIESCSYPVLAKPSKKIRKNSPAISSNELSLNEGVPKRTAYQNKCYYDSSDLYKPRPSFLATSRRSRALNPDSK